MYIKLFEALERNKAQGGPCSECNGDCDTILHALRLALADAISYPRWDRGSPRECFGECGNYVYSTMQLDRDHRVPCCYQCWFKVRTNGREV